MSIGVFNLLIMLSVKLLTVLAVYCDAKSDAIIDETKKRNHTLEWITIAAFGAIIMLVFYFTDSFSALSLWSLPLIWAGAFNPVYNSTRKWELWYVGDTDRWFDRQLKWASKIEADGSNKLPILTILYVLMFFFGLFLH
jgi:hypothetical protein